MPIDMIIDHLLQPFTPLLFLIRDYVPYTWPRVLLYNLYVPINVSVSLELIGKEIVIIIQEEDPITGCLFKTLGLPLTNPRIIGYDVGYSFLFALYLKIRDHYDFDFIILVFQQALA